MMPSWIRSSSVRPCPWYFFAIETTSRRFELTSRSFALLVAALDPLRDLDLLGGGQQRIAAGLVQEELQRVRRRRRDMRVRVDDVLLDRARAVVGQLDAVRVETLEQALDVVLFELELLHDLVQLRHVDAAVLFAVLDQECNGIGGHDKVSPAPRV